MSAVAAPHDEAVGPPPDDAAPAPDRRDDPGLASLDALRRYTWWSFVFFAAVTVLWPPFLSVPEWRDAPQHGAMAAVVLGAAGVAVVQLWLVHLSLASPRRPLRGAPVVATGLAAVVALGLPLLSPGTATAWGFPAAGLLAAALLHLPTRYRWPVGLGGTVAATSVAWWAERMLGDVSGRAVLITVVFSLVSIFAFLSSIWIWRVALRLDDARRTEADLAVVRERLRFAADLHDLQGHHLQVIALKAELLARLVGADDDRARRESAEVADIARTALAETRAVVQGYRQADLATEVGNAVAVLRAAGIETTVRGDPTTTPAAHAPLFGALVREGTTNLLRHSRATRATVDVGPGELALANDAPRAPRPTGDGTGLAGLRERFAAAGGEVDVEHGADEFVLRGRVS